MYCLPSTRESTRDCNSEGTSACFHLSLSNIKLRVKQKKSTSFSGHHGLQAAHTSSVLLSYYYPNHNYSHYHYHHHHHHISHHQRHCHRDHQLL